MNETTTQCEYASISKADANTAQALIKKCDNCRMLNDANNRLRQHARFLQLELDRARKIQSRMLPDLEKMPLADKLCWAGKYRPADMVGGDFYDARLTGPSRAAIIFGDVSGHGMGAALVTAVIKSAFQWWRPAELSLTEFLNELNTMLRKILPEGDFTAMVLGLFDATDNSFTYVNGGHHPEPLLLPGDSQGTVTQLDGSRGILLGVMDEPAYQSHQITLNKGDTVLLMTDGIIECQNTDGDMFGQSAARGLAAGLAGRCASEIAARVDQTVQKYTSAAAATDDRTILAMQLRPDPYHNDWMI